MRAHEAAPEAVLRLGRRFDVEAARAVRAAVRRSAPDVRLVVDLTGVPAVDPTALAVLAACLAERPAPALTLRGLTHQQERMLRYLGVELDSDDHAESTDPTVS